MRFLNDREELSKAKKKKNDSSDIEESKANAKEDDIFYNQNYPSNKVHCDICDKEITLQTKLLCAQCKIDICFICFANIKTVNNHDPSHQYHIINKLDFPLFQQNWSAYEELLLMEGLEKFGFGNWNDITDHISTNKTKLDVQNHYEHIYLDQISFLPNTSYILTKRNKDNFLEIKKIDSSKDDQQLIKNKDTNKDSDKKQNNQRTNIQNVTPKIETTTPNEIIGYMPLRGDFDIEYDNDAELLLAEMEFADDDNDTEIQMKFKILEIYNARLDERLKRKQFVIERDLLNFQKQSQLEKQRTKQEKEIYNLMKPFARFNTPDDHEKLVQSIIKEKKLQERLDELIAYRNKGFKNFSEIEEYNKNNRESEDDNKMVKKKSSNNNSNNKRNRSQRNNRTGDNINNKLAVNITEMVNIDFFF